MSDARPTLGRKRSSARIAVTTPHEYFQKRKSSTLGLEALGLVAGDYARLVHCANLVRDWVRLGPPCSSPHRSVLRVRVG